VGLLGVWYCSENFVLTGIGELGIGIVASDWWLFLDAPPSLAPKSFSHNEVSPRWCFWGGKSWGSPKEEERIYLEDSSSLSSVAISSESGLKTNKYSHFIKNNLIRQLTAMSYQGASQHMKSTNKLLRYGWHNLWINESISTRYMWLQCYNC